MKDVAINVSATNCKPTNRPSKIGLHLLIWAFLTLVNKHGKMDSACRVQIPAKFVTFHFTQIPSGKDINSSLFASRLDSLTLFSNQSCVFFFDGGGA